MFLLNHLGSFSLRQVLLLVKDRRCQESFCVCEFTQGEFLVICRMKGEFEDLVPSGHNAFVSVGKFDNCLSGVVMKPHFHIGLNVRLSVQSARIHGRHSRSFIFEGAIFVIIIRVILSEALIWTHSRRSAHTTSASILSFLVLFNHFVANGNVLSLDYMHLNLDFLPCLEVFWGAGSHKRSQFAASHEQILENLEEVGVLLEFVLLNHTLVHVC